MFLKCALRVPVAWWYSITQLLLRISPLLSLMENTWSGLVFHPESRKSRTLNTRSGERVTDEEQNTEHEVRVKSH